MFEEIEKAIAVLQNTNAGWVNRRDAVDYLTEAADKAVDTLNAYREEPDVDVQFAVEKGLGHLSARLAGIEPVAAAASQRYSLDELAQACAKPGQREVAPYEDGYKVEVTLKDGRRQQVYLMPYQEENRPSIIRVYTYCGKALRSAFRWALKSNMRMTYGAVALRKEEDEDRFLLVNNLLASETHPAEVKGSVKELSIYGDWIEKKLSGGEDTL